MGSANTTNKGLLSNNKAVTAKATLSKGALLKFFLSRQKIKLPARLKPFTPTSPDPNTTGHNGQPRAPAVDCNSNISPNNSEQGSKPLTAIAAKKKLAPSRFGFKRRGPTFKPLAKSPRCLPMISANKNKPAIIQVLCIK